MSDTKFNINVRGFLKIFDPVNNLTFVDTDNAIHYENMSEALALSVGNKNSNFISEMHFGNGGTTVDPTGVITYLPTNTIGQNSDLYNQTYFKIVDDTNAANNDPLRNKITIAHVPGQIFTDVVISCLLDFGEPSGQSAFDNSQNLDNEFTFDEIGLKGFSTAGAGEGKLLTHAIFSPVQKSLNRLIQIDYTVRIQTLTSLSSQM